MKILVLLEMGKFVPLLVSKNLFINVFVSKSFLHISNSNVNESKNPIHI